jgi:hypothetical protein
MFGSLNMERHDIGPRLLYVLRKLCNAPFNSTLSFKSAIRITTSGLRSPCAVEKFGRVSHLARTDWFISRVEEERPQQILDTVVDEGKRYCVTNDPSSRWKLCTLSPEEVLSVVDGRRSLLSCG